MSKFVIKVEHRPILGPEQIVTLAQMDAMLRGLPVTWKKIKLDDYNFYVPSWNDWKKIIEYLQPRVPSYIPDRRDCEFMADWFRVHVCEDFRINSLARVDGYADLGRGYPERHVWNLFTNEQYFYQLEPQNGVVMDIDDPLYVPDELIMG